MLIVRYWNYKYKWGNADDNIEMFKVRLLQLKNFSDAKYELSIPACIVSLSLYLFWEIINWYLVAYQDILKY